MGTIHQISGTGNFSNLDDLEEVVKSDLDKQNTADDHKSQFSFMFHRFLKYLPEVKSYFKFMKEELDSYISSIDENFYFDIGKKEYEMHEDILWCYIKKPFSIKPLNKEYPFSITSGINQRLNLRLHAHVNSNIKDIWNRKNVNIYSFSPIIDYRKKNSLTLIPEDTKEIHKNVKEATSKFVYDERKEISDNIWSDIFENRKSFTLKSLLGEIKEKHGLEEIRGKPVQTYIKGLEQSNVIKLDSEKREYAINPYDQWDLKPMNSN